MAGWRKPEALEQRPSKTRIPPADRPAGFSFPGSTGTDETDEHRKDTELVQATR